MDVTLKGNSPSTVTAGIMLLTRARQHGFPLTVSIVGDEREATPVQGPAVVYAAVLASCGVGRDLGSGATVVLPGPATEPIMVSVAPHGIGGWFLVDRTGDGAHPATQAFVRLSRDPRMAARRLGRDLRRAMEALGMAADTAILDVLFGAPVPPLLRLALALRAGRAMSGGRGESITRFLAGSIDEARDPVDGGTAPDQLAARYKAGDLRWLLDRTSIVLRDQVESWVDDALTLADEDGGRDLPLLVALTELATHLAQLPVHSILPPLGAAEDSVAVALASALHADGDVDANAQMCQVYRFLGGRFVKDADRPLLVSDTPAPSGDDRIEAWQWFSNEVRAGRKAADALWDEIFDPAQ